VIDFALGTTGRVDVLVNNAVHWGSAAPRPDATFETVPDDEWLHVLRDNIEGAIRLSRAVAPHLRAQRWGRLVHISSDLALGGAAGSEYYGAAKAALHGFSRSVAFGLGSSGDILSNVVVAGLTRTERNAFIVDGAGPADNPLGRWLDAEEMAAPVVFLASAANTGITGQIVPVM
jgi:3-oxoacyl-[acyl-carrier protein] reductase